MAAPQIPNLLSLRGAPRSRGRGRGRGFGTSSQSDADTQARKDKLLQATDSDASGSRMSAVNKGYLRDPYAKELALDDVPRRFPIINRGMYLLSLSLRKTYWLTHQAHMYAQPPWTSLSKTSSSQTSHTPVRSYPWEQGQTQDISD